MRRVIQLAQAENHNSDKLSGGWLYKEILYF
jgi:hypothetical protein